MTSEKKYELMRVAFYNLLKDSNYKYPIIYHSKKIFDNVYLYFGNDVSIYFTGIVFFPKILKLKFWCHTYADEEATLLYNIKVNGESLADASYMGSLKDCEGEFLEIEVCSSEELQIENISTVDVMISVKSEECKTTPELHLICEPRLELYAVGVDGE